MESPLITLSKAQTLDKDESDDTDLSSLSGSDFTLYSDEALSDDLTDGLDETTPKLTAVGTLISIEGKQAPPQRPPLPNTLKVRRSPLTKKRNSRRRGAPGSGQPVDPSHQTPLAEDMDSADEEPFQHKRRTTKKPPRNNPNKTAKKSPQLKKNLKTEGAAIVNIAKTKKENAILDSSLNKNKPSTANTKEPAKPGRADTKQKKGVKAVTSTRPAASYDITSSLSVEEFRASGDGASEDNDTVELRAQRLLDLEQQSANRSDVLSKKRFMQSASIDSLPAPSDGVESSGREATLSDSSEDSSDEETQKQEAAKSSQWLDFQAMADRISTTMKNTSTNMKKITDTTNVTKLVGGLIKEQIPQSTEGAWDKVDEAINSDSSSSHDFEDDYDPKTEKDLVGKAFGDYKDAKKKQRKQKEEPIRTEFEDMYNPEVNVDDPLAGAFGDGFRTSKPKEAATCDFDDDFTTSPAVTTKTSVEESHKQPSKSTKSKHTKDKATPKRPASKPSAERKPTKASNSKPQRPDVAPARPEPVQPSGKSKPTVPSNSPAKQEPKPQRPGKPTTIRPGRPAAQKKVETVAPEPSTPQVDLLGSIVDACTEPTEEITAETDLMANPKEPSNLDLLMGNAGDLPDTGFTDTALEELEPATVPKLPEIAKIRLEESADLSSRSSSTDLLDAFEFFNPAQGEPADAAEVVEPQPEDSGSSNLLTAPQINIIAASNENLTSDAMLDLDYLESITPTSDTNTPAAENFADDLDPLSSNTNELHIDTTSSSDPESDSGGNLVRDDTIDFDEIMSRPAAKNIGATKISSEVWAGTDDSGIGVEFKATFSADDDLSESTFTGNQAFENLIEKYGDAADGKTINENFEMGSKGRAEVTSTSDVWTKRAMKFARTFSETIDEDDDYNPDNPLSVEASTGLGLIVNPIEGDREDADGEENEEETERQVAPSTRHVWIDMSKPMPRAQAKPLTKKEKAMKAPPSSIKLLSQDARQSLQVKVKPVPRPKGRELHSPEESTQPVEDAEGTAKASSTKKLITQGQADNLNLTQLREHTTLTFEIERQKKRKKKNKTTVSLPALPPPPKSTTPTLIRKNPFNKSDSSSSEELSAQEEGMPVTSEINQNDDTEQLIEDAGDAANEEAAKARPAHTWEVLEKVELPPLEEFRPKYEGHGWKMLIRKPPKKSLTKKRFWEEVYLRLELDSKGSPCLLLYRNEKDAKKGAKELERAKLNPFHQLSDNIYLQQYDQYGKCHSIKILHVSYKERPSLRTDRVTEALPSFIKGYMKPNKATIFEHAPTVTELYKFGSLDYRSMRMFVWEVEDALQKLKLERINTNTMYQKNEIVADAWDEYEACIDREGHIVSHKARVRLFMICFVSGMPIIEVGINDRRRRGKEIVRRHEIIPVKAENWITVEDVELHHIVKREEYNESGVINFKPLDGSKFEFMRFRYRPKKNRELPLQIGTKMVIDREKRVIELRADLLIPGYYSNSKRKGQVPCENIQICFPIPEVWVYKFRVEKHQKMGSLHAAARKPGKVKGLERITTAFGKAFETYLPPSFIECSVGDAKYEHIFRSVVWRIDKLPRFNEGAYKSHYFALRLELGKHDTIPDSFQPDIQVEFVMPHTTVSGTAIRSISCSDLDEPPEKWVHHHARYEFTVEIDFESEIRQLLPEDNSISETDSKQTKASSDKPTNQDDSSEDESSIEIDENREDSDDTESEESCASMAMPNVEIKPEPTAESQGYETLLDFNTTEPHSDQQPPSNKGGEFASSHLSELLDLTEVVPPASPGMSPKPRRASIQQDDLDLL